MNAWTAAAFGAALVASGCAAGPAAPAALAAGTVDATILPRIVAPYGLQAVVAGYTAANVDHVVLKLARAGTLVPGAVVSVPRAGLGTAVTVRNLRAGTTYHVQAAAYADAAETTLLSDPTASSTAFTTPPVVTTGGVAAIDDADVSVPVAVTLAKKAVGAKLAFKVAVANNTRNRATHVRIRLLAGTTTVSERVEPLAQAEASHALTNLKLGTSYTILAQGLTLGPEVQISADAASTLTFTTPAAGGTSVEDDMNVVLGTAVATVPCSK